MYLFLQTLYVWYIKFYSIVQFGSLDGNSAFLPECGLEDQLPKCQTSMTHSIKCMKVLQLLLHWSEVSLASLTHLSVTGIWTPPSPLHLTGQHSEVSVFYPWDIYGTENRTQDRVSRAFIPLSFMPGLKTKCVSSQQSQEYAEN